MKASLRFTVLQFIFLSIECEKRGAMEKLHRSTSECALILQPLTDTDGGCWMYRASPFTDSSIFLTGLWCPHYFDAKDKWFKPCSSVWDRRHQNRVLLYGRSLTVNDGSSHWSHWTASRHIVKQLHIKLSWFLFNICASCDKAVSINELDMLSFRIYLRTPQSAFLLIWTP